MTPWRGAEDVGDCHGGVTDQKGAVADFEAMTPERIKRLAGLDFTIHSLMGGDLDQLTERAVTDPFISLDANLMLQDVLDAALLIRQLVGLAVGVPVLVVDHAAGIVLGGDALVDE